MYSGWDTHRHDVMLQALRALMLLSLYVPLEAFVRQHVIAAQQCMHKNYRFLRVMLSLMWCEVGDCDDHMINTLGIWQPLLLISSSSSGERCDHCCCCNIRH